MPLYCLSAQLSRHPTLTHRMSCVMRGRKHGERWFHYIEIWWDRGENECHLQHIHEEESGVELSTHLREVSHSLEKRHLSIKTLLAKQAFKNGRCLSAKIINNALYESLLTKLCVGYDLSKHASQVHVYLPCVNGCLSTVGLSGHCETSWRLVHSSTADSGACHELG